MKLRMLFSSREARFFDLLTEQSRRTIEGIRALEEYMKHSDEQATREVRRLEGEADDLRRDLINEINRSFVTPIDREDLFALSRTIDDVLDYGNTTVDEMIILGLKPNPYLQSMVSILREGAEELHQAVLELRKRPKVALEHALRVKATENRVENAYRQALADLFEAPRDLDHVVEMLKMRELYRHLSNAADRSDEAANILTDIVVKTT